MNVNESKRHAEKGTVGPRSAQDAEGRVQGWTWKKIWEKVDSEEKKLLAIEFIEEERIGRYRLSGRNKKEKRYNLYLIFKFDAPHLTKLLGDLDDFSEQDKEIYLKAKNALAQLYRDAEIVFSAKETKESFMQMISEMQRFYRNRKRKYEAFQRKVQRVAEIVKEANKVIKKYNSEIVRERRAAKEAERKALAEARYEEVSDKMLKDFFNLKNVTVLDKSSKHRAVLFAHLVDYYNMWNNPGPFKGWAVDELILAGVDDNEEQWEIHIDVMRKDYDDGGYLIMEECAPLTEISRVWDVEKAMAKVWGVEGKYIIQKSLRQGDILIVPLPGYEKTIEKEIDSVIADRNKGGWRGMATISVAEVKTTKNISPSPNHEITSEKEFKYAKVTIKHSSLIHKEEREELYIETAHSLVMRHISHKPVEIPPGKWLILTQLEEYKEQNVD